MKHFYNTKNAISCI
jgi:hypothetical protein